MLAPSLLQCNSQPDPWQEHAVAVHVGSDGRDDRALEVGGEAGVWWTGR